MNELETHGENKKTVLSAAHKQAATCPTVTINRPKKLRSWSGDSMQVAIDAVKSGRKGVNCVVLGFGVPCTTLKERITGGVVHGTKSGLKPYLTHLEGKNL